MNNHYNIALLKTLIEPLSSSFENIIEQLKNIANGDDFSEDIIINDINNILGSVKMIGKHSSIVFAKEIKNSIKNILSYEKLGWDHIKLSKSVNSLIHFVSNYNTYLVKLSEDKNGSSVFLWEDFYEMCKNNDLSLIDKTVLFDIEADTDNVNFSALEKDSLKKVAKPHLDKYKTSLNKLLSLGLDEQKDVIHKDKFKELIQCLFSIGEVFDWAYMLKHRRGYHGYWLVSRARIMWEINKIKETSTEDYFCENLTKSLKLGLIELNKFVEDYRGVSYSSIYQMIYPMLLPWNNDYKEKYQVFEDVVDMYGLEKFWKTYSNDSDNNNNKIIESQILNIDKITEYSAKIKDLWIEISSNERFVSNENKEKEFIQIFSLLKSNCERIKNEDVNAVIDLLSFSINEIEKTNNKITSDLSIEIATLFVLFDQSLENMQNNNVVKLTEQINLLGKRIKALLIENDLNKYHLLPNIEWDKDSLFNKYKLSYKAIIKEILVFLKDIEEVFDEFINLDENAAKNRYKEIKQKLLIIQSIVEIINQKQTLKIINKLFDYIDIIKDGESSDKYKNELENIAIILTGLSGYFNLLEQSDEKSTDILYDTLSKLNLLDEVKNNLTKDNDVLENMFKDLKENDDYINNHKDNKDDNLKQTDVEEIFMNEPVENNKSKENEEIKIISSKLKYPQKETTEIFNKTLSSSLNDDEVVISDVMSDDEILNIFMEEIESIYINMESCLRDYTNNSVFDNNNINTLYRQFHTLKGSGRTCELWAIGEFFERIENAFDKLLIKENFSNKAVADIVNFSLNIIKKTKSHLSVDNIFSFSVSLIKEEDDLIKDMFSSNNKKAPDCDIENEITSKDISLETIENDKHDEINSADEGIENKTDDVDDDLSISSNIFDIEESQQNGNQDDIIGDNLQEQEQEQESLVVLENKMDKQTDNEENEEEQKEEFVTLKEETDKDKDVFNNESSFIEKENIVKEPVKNTEEVLEEDSEEKLWGDINKRMINITNEMNELKNLFYKLSKK